MSKTNIRLEVDDFDVPIAGVIVTATLEQWPAFNNGKLLAKRQVIGRSGNDGVIVEGANPFGVLPSEVLSSPGHTGSLTYRFEASYLGKPLNWGLSGVPIPTRAPDEPLGFGNLQLLAGTDLGTPAPALDLDAATVGGQSKTQLLATAQTAAHNDTATQIAALPAPTSYDDSNLATLNPITGIQGVLRDALTSLKNLVGNVSAYGRTLTASQDAPAARNALGLGNAATRDVGNTAGTVMAGDAALAVPNPIILTALTNTGIAREIAKIQATLTDSADATRTSKLPIIVVKNGVEIIPAEFTPDGLVVGRGTTGKTIQFYGDTKNFYLGLDPITSRLRLHSDNGLTLSVGGANSVDFVGPFNLRGLFSVGADNGELARFSYQDTGSYRMSLWAHFESAAAALNTLAVRVSDSSPTGQVEPMRWSGDKRTFIAAPSTAPALTFADSSPVMQPGEITAFYDLAGATKYLKLRLRLPDATYGTVSLPITPDS